MTRRDFIKAITYPAALWPIAAHAKQTVTPVIGLLLEVPAPASVFGAFRQGMAELGYLEGKNFATEYRIKPESLAQAAADLVRLNVNVIFAAAPEALAAATRATTSIPVVGLDLENDPVARG